MIERVRVHQLVVYLAFWLQVQPVFHKFALHTLALPQNGWQCASNDGLKRGFPCHSSSIRRVNWLSVCSSGNVGRKPRITALCDVWIVIQVRDAPTRNWKTLFHVPSYSSKGFSHVSSSQAIIPKLYTSAFLVYTGFIIVSAAAGKCHPRSIHKSTWCLPERVHASGTGVRG